MAHLIFNNKLTVNCSNKLQVFLCMISVNILNIRMSQKFCNIFIIQFSTIQSSDSFTEAMKVRNYTGL